MKPCIKEKIFSKANTNKRKKLVCVKFGELKTQMRSVTLSLNSTLLVILKEDLIVFHI